MEWLKDKLGLIAADLFNSWRSLTIWVNGISLTVVSALPMLQENIPQLQDYVSPHFYKQMMFTVVAANIVLRFKTKSALRDK